MATLQLKQIDPTPSNILLFRVVDDTPSAAPVQLPSYIIKMVKVNQPTYAMSEVNASSVSFQMKAVDPTPSNIHLYSPSAQNINSPYPITIANIVLKDQFISPLILSLIESIGYADAATKGYSVKESDLLSVSDLLAAQAQYARTTSDSFSITESFKDTVGKAASEILMLTEDKAIRPSRALQETLSIAEQSYKNAGKNFTDSFTISESATFLKYLLLILNEAFAISDSKAADVSRYVSDALLFTEQSVRQFVKKNADSLSYSDSLTYLDVIMIHLVDYIALHDALSRELDSHVGLSDSLLMQDLAAKSIVKEAFLESIIMADDASRSFNLSVQDVTTLGDSFIELLDRILKYFHQPVREGLKMASKTSRNSSVESIVQRSLLIRTTIK